MRDLQLQGRRCRCRRRGPSPSLSPGPAEKVAVGGGPWGHESMSHECLAVPLRATRSAHFVPTLDRSMQRVLGISNVRF
eukprot:15465049-Alexandrium_andersonii.AAC.1